MIDFVSAPDTDTSPTSEAPPAPATPGAPAPQSATPAAPPAPATGVVQDDRHDWVPPHRIRETREAALRQAQQGWAQKETEYQQQLKQIQTQLHALVGVTPPQDAEVASVRQQFAKLYPGLAKLEDKADNLLGLGDRAGDMEAQVGHYWQSYGQQTMDRLFEQASTALGGPLTDQAKRTLHAAFTGYVSSSPELEERYAHDPTIVQDFMKAFQASFIDPARRVAAATVTGRAATILPQDTPGGAPRSSPVPQLKDLDERAAAGWALYNQPKT